MRVLALPVQDGRESREDPTQESIKGYYCYHQGRCLLLGSVTYKEGRTHGEHNITMESHFKDLDRRSGSLCTLVLNRDLCKCNAVSLLPPLICKYKQVMCNQIF